MIFYERCEKEKGKDYAYRVLKNNIMSLNLKPGEALSEVELSQKLNLSRTPIREVISRLKNEHLIEVKPQSGTYVSLIDLDLVENAMFMRAALEEKVLDIACESFDEEILIELEKNIFAQEIISTMEGGESEFYKLDNDFHRLLFKSVSMDYVWDSIVKISTHYNRMRVLTQIKDKRKLVVKQHSDILNAIKNKSKSSIEGLMKEHIYYSKKNWCYFTDSNDEISSYFKKK